MALLSMQPTASCLKKAVLASGLLLIAAHGYADLGPQGPFRGLSDYQLLLDLREFQVSLGPPPEAQIEFTAKILSRGGRIIDSRAFQAEAPVKSMEAASVSHQTESLRFRSFERSCSVKVWARCPPIVRRPATSSRLPLP
jgi:hypothetical protein